MWAVDGKANTAPLLPRGHCPVPDLSSVSAGEFQESTINVLWLFRQYLHLNVSSFFRSDSCKQAVVIFIEHKVIN
jgi:hypothetical protein